MQFSPRGCRLPLGLALLALLVTGCGASPTGTATPTTTLGPTPAPTATATPAGHLAVLQVTNSTSGSDATAADMSATATCPQGSTLVGGGYHIQPGNDQQILFVRSTYPSAADAWTVTEANPQSGGFVGLDVFAYCATASNVTFTVTTPSVKAAASGKGAASCPAGSTLIGGGFEQPTLTGSGRVMASYPANNAWQVTGPAQQNGAANLTIFALCASRPVTAHSIAQATAAIANNAGGDAEAQCPQPAHALGGGYSATGGGTYIGLENWVTDRGFTQWGVGAENQYQQPRYGGPGATPTPPAAMQVTAYAVCVTYP